MNVMAKAHKAVKDAIKAQADNNVARTHTYAQMLSIALKVIHKEFKDMRTESEGVKSLTTVTTHDLQNGDVIFHHGVYFQLAGRKEWPMRKDDCPDRQGVCVTLTGTPIASNEHHGFPVHWMKDFGIQGNKMATWCKVEAK